MPEFQFPKRLFVLLTVLILAAEGAAGEEFFYRYESGTQYRILSTVEEEVYLNQRLNHRARILNRIAVEVGEVQGGAARHEAVFETAEQSRGIDGGQWVWSRQYESQFDRDRLGHITIDSAYFMPVVRNVPVFPGRDLKPGDSWSAEGHEMHDFRDSFGIAAPYRIPFTANYTFLGSREWKGSSYPAFSVSYIIVTEPEAAAGVFWPRRIVGSSSQIVYWNSEAGREAAYEETFRMVFELSDGTVLEYRGTAEAELIESAKLDKEAAAREISGDIARLGLEDTSVRVVEEGIAISLENIQFEADSAELVVGEKAKLDQIAGILRRYGDRDILVGGHTALAGGEEGRLRLSRERAAAVADYLVKQGARQSDRIVLRGYGAEQPLGDNNTEAGRRRNRRVEITILEN
ncbi:MAG: OmpA family protein [Spirochaetaceae bacterium]|jgi:outer membrane protein OmpA-like peptidoglycan-associated protein|nr:OmpA family protein [Spirochaetaceae bacterium]